MAALLEVKDLKTEFHTQDGVVHAVNGVSFTVDEGETLGIVGESGCGKSISVLSVMRLIPIPPGKITDGEVNFQGRDLLNINQQLSEALELHLNMDKDKARKRSIELLEMVGIPAAAERIDNYPHQFSGGMRQRVMIAMGLSCNPQLLIADEPTTALDVTIQAQILDLVKKLKKEIGMSMIWITHDLGVVAGLADRVNVMYAGFIVETAPVREIYGSPRHPYTLGLLN